jgi:mRNA-degrading endonuclease toxin of MazEF toxin-antitoxin module
VPSRGVPYDRRMARDIGGYFDRLTKKARGGRRLEGKGRTTAGRASSTVVLPPEGVVTIEYSPRIDGDPDPGEVVWAWVPFEEDHEQGKDRPVVVIGRRGQKLVCVPLTTKRDHREAQITVGTGEWDPKRRTSYARIWRMLDIDAADARREGAVLDRRRFDEVVAAVDRYYEVRRPATNAGSTRVAPNDLGVTDPSRVSPGRGH